MYSDKCVTMSESLVEIYAKASGFVPEAIISPRGKSSNTCSTFTYDYYYMSLEVIYFVMVIEKQAIAARRGSKMAWIAFRDHLLHHIDYVSFHKNS
jgi:hypothetical protein